MKEDINKTHILANRVRRIILDQAKRANVGHIGSALSIADIIAALYGEIMRIPDPHDPERDRFILSKGHAALAVYAALFLKGWLSEKCLNTYCTDGTLLGVHPEHALSGIDFSTGSLGHGLSLGAGAALAACLQNSPRRVFVLVSDAECNEGTVWEAIMFAKHHQLSNLIAIVDCNKQQALGYTEKILDLSPIAEHWRVFGWHAIEIDGHNVSAIVKTVSSLDVVSGPPHVLVARTVSGKGVSFMEDKVKWHYCPMSNEEYEQAVGEVKTRE